MKRRQVSQELKAAQEHVERWRERAGGRGSRIPEELWSEAIGLARAEGVYATAKALRLNYERLRERVTGAGDAGKVGGKSTRETRATRSELMSSGFIDLGMAPLGGGGKTVVEIEGRDGVRLRIDVGGASGVDVVELARAFWSRP